MAQALPLKDGVRLLHELIRLGAVAGAHGEHRVIATHGAIPALQDTLLMAVGVEDVRDFAMPQEAVNESERLYDYL